MPRYAAFLRGINVTGTRIKADALCAPFGALGFENVASFRASGNIVFDAPRESAPALARRIEQQLDSELGLSKAVTFVRTAAEMRKLAEHEPFPSKDVAASKGKVQVMFLGSKVSAAAQKQLLALAADEDRLAFGDREIFWLPSGGMSDSPLDLKAVDKLAGVSTHRTKGTVELIYAKFFAD
jgi:uncharacterized protein (DUF1697 family)